MQRGSLMPDHKTQQTTLDGIFVPRMPPVRTSDGHIVDWERQRITVPSPKTERHGKPSRQIPLFPELVPILQEAWELAPDGSQYVIQNETYHRASRGKNGWKNMNLRTQFERIICYADLEPWPRLFHNLRASRETELVSEYPVQVVTQWLGNTPAIALRHYLQVTDEHFAKAVQNPVQNPVQQGAARSRMDSQGELADSPKPCVCGPMREQTSPCENMEIVGMGPAGFEPATKGL